MTDCAEHMTAFTRNELIVLDIRRLHVQIARSRIDGAFARRRQRVWDGAMEYRFLQQN